MTASTGPVKIRQARSGDLAAIVALYRAAAATPGGIARVESEVSTAYVARFLAESLRTGIALVASDATSGSVVGELHCHALGPACFAHLLGELTVAVHPSAQGRGVGRGLFAELLRRVRDDRPDVTRIELVARESNARAIALYESIGFVREGRLEGRIAGRDGGVEADIPMAWRRGQ